MFKPQHPKKILENNNWKELGIPINKEKVNEHLVVAVRKATKQNPRGAPLSNPENSNVATSQLC